MKFTLPKIYPITDKRLAGLTHAEQTARFVEAGAKLIQLRDKESPPYDFFEDALQAVRIAHERGARILINDRVDIAFMSGSDGVHLGQNDLPVSEARRQLGEKAIIGLSTHNLTQAQLAVAEGMIDYLTSGPIFSTNTKSDPEPLVGLDGFRAVRKVIVDLPLVAIGGINSENLASIFDAGADSIATISALFDADSDIGAKYKWLENLCPPS